MSIGNDMNKINTLLSMTNQMDAAIVNAVELLRKVHGTRLHGNIKLEGKPPQLTTQLSVVAEEPYPIECGLELTNAIKWLATAYGGNASIYLKVIRDNPPAPYMELIATKNEGKVVAYDLVHSVCTTLTQEEFDDQVAKYKRVVFSRNPLVLYDSIKCFVQIGFNSWSIQ